MSIINAILKERRLSHGDFAVQSKYAQDLKKVLHGSINWDKLEKIQKEGLEMIVHKIARILSGNPDLIDHYDDIAGYATLISRKLSETSDNPLDSLKTSKS